MDVFYEKDINRTYMILSEKEEQKIDYQVPMLEKNQISGLLPFHMKQVDREIQYCYEISGKISIGKWAEENKLKYEQIKRMMDCLANTIKGLESYLLSAQSILLEENYIYIDIENWNVYFCYYPPNNKENEVGLQLLLQFILKKIDHKDPDAIFLAYRFFQESLNENISLKKLQIIMEKKESNEWSPYRKESEPKEREAKKERTNLEEEQEEEYLEEQYSEKEGEKKGVFPKNLWDNRSKAAFRKNLDEKNKEQKKSRGMSNWASEKGLRWKLPERLESFREEEHLEEETEKEKIETKNEQEKTSSEKLSTSDKIWMAVPFLTLLAVIVIFSGKVVEIQKVWAKYPWICIGILLFVIGANFIIVKHWYFDEE